MGCSDFIQPLDFKCIFVNTLSGNLEIFTFLLFIFVSGLAGYFRMPNIITLAMFVLLTIFLAPYVGALYVLVVLLVGLFVYYSIGKLFTRS